MTGEPPASETIIVCAVCGEVAPEALTAECNWCDRVFHLNQRNDGDAKDCGQVWIDEQFLALQFACFDCLRGETPEAEKAPAQGRPAKTQRQRRYKRRA